MEVSSRMKKHFLIQHTADIRLHVEGTSLPELFTAALEGMASIILLKSCNGAYDASVHLSLVSPDTTALLVDFLSETLTQSQINKTVYCCAQFIQLTETTLEVVLQGKIVDHFDEDIKAVTYHEAQVVQNKEGQLSNHYCF